MSFHIFFFKQSFYLLQIITFPKTIYIPHDSQYHRSTYSSLYRKLLALTVWFQRISASDTKGSEKEKRYRQTSSSLCCQDLISRPISRPDFWRSMWPWMNSFTSLGFVSFMWNCVTSQGDVRSTCFNIYNVFREVSGTLKTLHRYVLHTTDTRLIWSKRQRCS